MPLHPMHVEISESERREDGTALLPAQPGSNVGSGTSDSLY